MGSSPPQSIRILLSHEVHIRDHLRWTWMLDLDAGFHLYE